MATAGSTPTRCCAGSTALQRFLDAVDGHLPADRLVAAHTVVERAGDRLALSRDHTVVALAGATGSGKSSLFNALAQLAALAGRGAPADHRRRARLRVGQPPTAPASCSTGSACCPATGSPGRARSTATTRRRCAGWSCSTCPTSTRSSGPTGSRSTGCSAWSTSSSGWSTRRSTPTGWCTSSYLREFHRHRDVTVVVLNQADRLARGRPADGASPTCAGCSTTTGWPGCRCSPTAAVQDARRSADLRRAAGADGRRAAGRAAPARRRRRRASVGDLGDAGRAAPAADDVDRATVAPARRRARRRRRGARGRRGDRAGLPAPGGRARPAGRWSQGWRRLRPDPLRRLHLPDRPAIESADDERAGAGHLGAGPTAAQRAALGLAVRDGRRPGRRRPARAVAGRGRRRRPVAARRPARRARPRGRRHRPRRGPHAALVAARRRPAVAGHRSRRWSACCGWSPGTPSGPSACRAWTTRWSATCRCPPCCCSAACCSGCCSRCWSGRSSAGPPGGPGAAPRRRLRAAVAEVGREQVVAPVRDVLQAYGEARDALATAAR